MYRALTDKATRYYFWDDLVWVCLLGMGGDSPDQKVLTNRISILKIFRFITSQVPRSCFESGGGEGGG